MRQILFLLTLVLVLALAAGIAWADQVTGLTTFTANTTAYASEVNANFEEVRLSVNDNDARMPGLASIASWPSVTLGTSTSSVMSRAITIPSAGYVLALASGTMIFTHTNGTTQTAIISVNDVGTSTPGYYQTLSYPSALPTATYYTTFAFNGTFNFGASGTYTIHLVGNSSAATGVDVYDRQLNLIYLPESYGSVTALSASGIEGIGEQRPPME